MGRGAFGRAQLPELDARHRAHKGFVNIFVGRISDGSKQDCYRNLALAVHFYRQYVLVRCLELQPSAPVRYQFGTEKLAAGVRVFAGGKVRTGRAYKTLPV